MLYAEQHTPPFNSPYQTHASRSDSFLESPYTSPNRNDAMPQYPQGLGLYNYSHQMPTTLPPSPSPSDCWTGHTSTGASPPMTHAIADPWASGAFDHPVTRYHQDWSPEQVSPRSSLSSATMIPLYSHAGPDGGYYGMNTTYGQQLPSPRHRPLTVAPERLSSAPLSNANTYGSSQVTKIESTDTQQHEDRTFSRAPSERSIGSHSSYPGTPANPHRRRNRRVTDPSMSVFHCRTCNKPFARQYNLKQHMMTHKENRERPHVCPWADCRKGFFRKTDLDRHDISIHQKMKEYVCARCPAKYARKDTCSR